MAIHITGIRWKCPACGKMVRDQMPSRMCKACRKAASEKQQEKK